MDKQLADLRDRVKLKFPDSEFSATPLPNGGVLISIDNVPLDDDWNRRQTKVLFVQPPGYPGAAPDCFWAEPAALRLKNGGTPQNTNDSNPIPGDPQPGRSVTWFSWHVQAWNPSSDQLTKFFQLILDRLKPAR